MSDLHYNNVLEAFDFIQSKSGIKPKYAIICGSGLGELADLLENIDIIEYSSIPNFPTCNVVGHRGRLVLGTIDFVPVICMQGRFHIYEGYSMQQITFPIRVLKQLGVEIIILSNAAGGINRSYNVGDIVMIKDHVFFPGLSGNHPLIGTNESRFGTRFPSMINCYSRRLREMSRKAAEQHHLTACLKEGVYAMLSGPSFETVAEIRMLLKLDIDVVGMSTAAEVIAARHSGIEVLAFSVVTNICAIDYDNNTCEPTHNEVLHNVQESVGKIRNIIEFVIKNIG